MGRTSTCDQVLLHMEETFRVLPTTRAYHDTSVNTLSSDILSIAPNVCAHTSKQQQLTDAMFRYPTLSLRIGYGSRGLGAVHKTNGLAHFIPGRHACMQAM
jgi:hypothetical protein